MVGLLVQGSPMLTTVASLQCLSDIADLPEMAAGGAVAAAAALPLVSDLLGGTLATWNRLSFDGGGHAEEVVADPPGTWVAAAVDDVEAELNHHPLADVVFSQQAGVVRMTDVVSQRRWVSHPIYAELLRPRGVPQYSVLVPLTLRSTEISFLMLNRDLDFDDRDVEALTLLQGGLSVLLRTPATGPTARLTPREIQVLHVLSGGAGRTATARALGISTATVAKHVENIHEKLGTHDIVSTLRVATAQGLLTFPLPRHA